MKNRALVFLLFALSAFFVWKASNKYATYPRANNNKKTALLQTTSSWKSLSILKKNERCIFEVKKIFYNSDNSSNIEQLRKMLSKPQTELLDESVQFLVEGSGDKSCQNKFSILIEIFFEPNSKILTFQWSVSDFISRNKVEEFAYQL